MNAGMTAVIDAFPYLLAGSVVTVSVVIGALAFGFLLGLPLAVGQVYGGPVPRRLIALHVWFFRGVPLLVLLFLFYFGLCSMLHINLSAFAVAVIVLGLISSAYQSQIFRGTMLAIPEGQLKAARVLGMSDPRAIFFIILPQALRLAIPGWSNEYSIILKDSAVTYALGVAEIMARTHFVATRTYQHLPLYLAAGLIHPALTSLGVKALQVLERRSRIPGYSRQGQ